ncbi:hypothetical protein HanPSC8_Chr10g0420401 [Helianthus annuus]|nr:hypothetical protein HanPSC8_Chr10g0420401 [Helianthus annuus]
MMCKTPLFRLFWNRLSKKRETRASDLGFVKIWNCVKEESLSKNIRNPFFNIG